MERRKTFRTHKGDAGLRLDVFLQGEFEDFSRSWIQKLIKKGNVTVDGKKPLPSYRVKGAELLRVHVEAPPTLSADPEPHVSPAPAVACEHKDFLIIDKPAGLVVHPGEPTPRGTLVNWLLAHYTEIGKVGENAFRPGIVHRLDRETSGLMVVARNSRAFEWFKRQFKERRVKKTYTALVLGRIAQESGTVTFPIGRSRSDPTKQRVFRKDAPESARTAVTHWRVLVRYPGLTLLEVTPVTGRMHQIRVHLAAIGHPVAGDKKYARKGMRTSKYIGRLFLHAASLSFRGLHGGTFSFTSPLPAELEDALRSASRVVE